MIFPPGRLTYLCVNSFNTCTLGMDFVRGTVSGTGKNEPTCGTLERVETEETKKAGTIRGTLVDVVKEMWSSVKYTAEGNGFGGCSKIMEETEFSRAS